MWLFSADGANRFDGNNFLFYDNIGRSTGCTVRHVFGEDKHENLWYYAQRKLCKVNLKSGKLYEVFQSTERFFVQIDLRGRLWICEGNGIIRDFDEHSKKSNQIFKISNNNQLKYLTVQKPSQFIFYVSDGGKKLYRFDIHNGKTTLLYDNLGITCQSYNGNDFWLVNKGKQLIKITTNALPTEYPLNINTPNFLNSSFCCANETTKDIWYNKGDSIFKNSFIGGRENLEYVLPKITILTQYFDSHDNLWIGTDGAGAIMINTKQPAFKKYPTDETLQPELNPFFIKSIYDKEDGDVLIGLFEKGIYNFNLNTKKLFEIPSFPQKKFKTAYSLCTGVEGKLYAGTDSGLFVYNKQLNAFSRANDFKQNIFIIKKYKNGLLFGTNWGFHFYDIKKNRVLSFDSIGINDKLISIDIDKEDKIWVGTETKGIYIIKPSDIYQKQYSFQHIFNSPKLVNAFYADEKRNVMWVATAIGLQMYSIGGTLIKTFTTKEGLSNNYIYSIIPDSMNRLWLGTNNGLNVFNPKTHVVQVYTENDGLPSNEFNTNAYLCGKNGILFLGTIKGIIWFNPMDVSRNPYLPQVIINNIKINDGKDTILGPLKDETTLHLNYTQNTFTISTGILEFSNPQKNAYRYMIKEIDNGWIEGNSSHEIRYNKLSPGSYTFLLIGSNGDGTWTSNPLKLKIIISPPLWRTNFAYLIYTLAFTTLLFFLFKWLSNRKLKKKLLELEKEMLIHHERERLARDLHDSLGSSLTHIILQTKSLERETSEDRGLHQKVQKINRTSEEIVNRLKDIVWVLNSDDIELQDLIAQIRENSNTLFESSIINLNFNVNTINDNIKLTNNFSRNVYFCTMEALNNIIKHSKAQNAWVNIEFNKENELNISITDDGLGLQEISFGSGNGLQNIKKRIADIDGQIIFANHTPSGTQIIIKLLILK